MIKTIKCLQIAAFRLSFVIISPDFLCLPLGCVMRTSCLRLSYFLAPPLRGKLGPHFRFPESVEEPRVTQSKPETLSKKRLNGKFVGLFSYLTRIPRPPEENWRRSMSEREAPCRSFRRFESGLLRALAHERKIHQSDLHRPA